MDSLLFIVVLGVFGMTAWWYAANEQAGSDGAVGGWLALRQSGTVATGEEREARYRVRRRASEPTGMRQAGQRPAGLRPADLRLERKQEPGERAAYRSRDPVNNGDSWRPRASRVASESADHSDDP